MSLDDATRNRFRMGTASFLDVEALVESAGGDETVSVDVYRVKPPGRRNTIRLMGVSGPSSSEDAKPRQVGSTTWRGTWRVAELKLWLKRQRCS